MSIPDETPAAVTYLPSKTTRSPVGSAPKPGSWSSASQWEVARRPLSRPAAARISEPVHTEVVQVVWASTARIHSCSGPSVMCASCPGPPGTTRMSGAVTSSSVASATSPSEPRSLRCGPVRSATNTVSVPGTRLRVS